MNPIELHAELFSDDEQRTEYAHIQSLAKYDGYYWIKRKSHHEAEIAEYVGNKWLSPGRQQPLKNDFRILGRVDHEIKLTPQRKVAIRTEFDFAFQYFVIMNSVIDISKLMTCAGSDDLFNITIAKVTPTTICYDSILAQTAKAV